MSNDSFSSSEIAALREIAGTMVPADAGLGMPGADDPAILADIVKSVGRDLPRVREALAEIAARSGASSGGAFGTLDRDKREALINGYHASGAPPMAALGRVVVSAYYRDDRVLLALSHEARAPFPKGHEVEQGDWSLLEVVRNRPAFWRDDRKESAK
jgi:hypothetical protein